MQLIFLLHDFLETDYKDSDRRGKPPTPDLPGNPSNWDKTNKGKFMFVSNKKNYFFFPSHSSNDSYI